MGLFDGIKFPYLNTQELNLDWIMTRIKELMGFMPTDGDVGDILMRKSDGASWEPPTAVQVDIDGLPEDTQIMNNDQLIFYDISVQANRKIKPPNLLDSMCSDAYPLMDGTAAAGTSKKPARYDHVHPTDTTRAPANYFQNGSLKLEHGGTGADNAADSRTNLGLGDVATKDVVPVSMGGTDANNAGDARTNLGIAEPYNNTTLFNSVSGVNVVNGATINLLDDYTNYKFIILTLFKDSVVGSNRMEAVVYPELENLSTYYPIAHYTTSGSIRMDFSSPTQLEIISAHNFTTLLLTDVKGIK